MVSLMHLFFTWVLISMGEAVNYKTPIESQTNDMCSSGLYMSNQWICEKCPGNCKECYVNNSQILCSSCKEGFFYVEKNKTCVQTCELGYWLNSLVQQCIQCSIRFCNDCSQENSSISCSQCMDGYSYDESNKICKLDCGLLYYDTLRGTCVDQCADKEMTQNQNCISQIQCPDLKNLQNFCSMSSIIKILLSYNKTSIIAVGVTNINIFSLPSMTLQIQHTIQRASPMVDCSLISGDDANLYCLNSQQQIIKFKISNLEETLVSESKGFFRGYDDNQSVYLTDQQIIVTSSLDVIEKINLLSGQVSRIALQSDYFSNINPAEYWSQRNLLLLMATKSTDSQSVLLIISQSGESDLELLEISWNNDSYSIFFIPQRIFTIDKSSVVIYNWESLLYCKVQRDVIASQSDFICDENQVIQFSSSAAYSDLKLYQQDGLIVVFSMYQKILNILDCSLGMDAIIAIGYYEEVLAYQIQNGILFLVTISSNLQIITLDRTQIQQKIIIANSFSSINLSNSLQTFLLGVLFDETNHRIFLNDQYEVYLIELSEDPSVSKTLGESSKTLFQNQKMIEFSHSSKCEIHYSMNIKLNAIKEDNSDGKGLLIFIHPYSVIFRSILAHSGQNSFQLYLPLQNGYIKDSIFYPKNRVLIIIQSTSLTLISLNSQQIEYSTNNFIYGISIIKSSFTSVDQIAISTYFPNTNGEITITLVSLITFQPTDLLMQLSQWNQFSKYDIPFSYIFIIDQNNSVQKYNEKGDIIQTFLGYNEQIGYSESLIFDNDNQLLITSNAFLIFSLQSQVLLSTFSIINLDPFQSSYFFYYQNNINGIWFTNQNILSWYKVDGTNQFRKLQSFNCPGSMSLPLKAQFFSQGNLVVIRNQTEQMFCVIALEKSLIQYIENQSYHSIVSTFSTDTDYFLFTTTNELTQIFQQKIGSSESQLIKLMDIPEKCLSLRQFDDNSGICVNDEFSNAVFFPFMNQFENGESTFDFQIVDVVYQGNYSIFIGLRTATIVKMKEPIFTYTLEETRYPDTSIQNVIFIESTLNLVIVWSQPFIQHFNVTSNALLNEITQLSSYLNFSYSQEYIIYLAQNSSKYLIPQQILMYSLKTQSIVFQQILDPNANTYDTQINESKNLLYLMSYFGIYRLDLQTFLFSSMTYNLSDIRYYLLTDTALIALPDNLEVGLVIDPTTLRLISQPVLPGRLANGQNDSSLFFNELDYELVSVASNQASLILDLSYAFKVVILSMPSLTKQKEIIMFTKYAVLDVDQENSLFCSFSIDNLVSIYSFSQDIDTVIFQMSLGQFFEIKVGYKGVDYVKKVQAKIVWKYKVLVTVIDNIMRIHSIDDGLLRLVIQKQGIQISQFQYYLNNYFLAIGDTSIVLFNIESALFRSQNFTYQPIFTKSFQIPIGNIDLLADSELPSAGFPFPYAIGSTDSDPSCSLFSMGEKVQTSDERYPIEISQDFEKDNSNNNNNNNENVSQTSNSVLSNFADHRMYYISRADMLYGIEGTTIFKHIQLARNPKGKDIDKFFFVSRNYVTHIRYDYVTVFSLDLQILATNQLSTYVISRVLAVPSEINSDKFIFISSDNRIGLFDLVSNQFQTISQIQLSRGKMSYFFFLSASESQRLLVVGFSDLSYLSISLKSFSAIWTEQSQLSPAFISQVNFQSTPRMLSSETIMYLVTNERNVLAIPFKILASSDQLTLTVVFSDPITLPVDNVNQFFFDKYKNRIIFFSRKSNFIQFGYFAKSTSDAIPLTSSDFILKSSSTLYPIKSNVVLFISNQYDQYIFFEGLSILVMYASEMKIRLLISDSQIYGEIKQVYPLTHDILIVTTTTALYTLSIVAPQKDDMSQYIISSSIIVSEATILFYRFQKPIFFFHQYLISLEGISEDGAFVYRIPVDIYDSSAAINCGISLTFDSNQDTASLFQDQLMMIVQLNTEIKQTKYVIENFLMTYFSGPTPLSIYLVGMIFKYFRIQGGSSTAIIWIYPDSDFSKLTGDNFHIKDLILMMYFPVNYPGNVVKMKQFTKQKAFTMDNTIFTGRNLGFTFEFLEINRVLLNEVTFISQNLSLEVQSYSTSRLLATEATSFSTFLNITSLIMFIDVKVIEIKINSYTQMFSFISSNSVVFNNCLFQNITFSEESVDYQSLILFTDITNLEIVNLTLENIYLESADLLQFYSIDTVLIKNLTIKNVTCIPQNVLVLPFLLNFQGIQNLQIIGLTLINIKNCLLMNADLYKLEVTQQLNIKFVMENVLFDEIIFNPILIVPLRALKLRNTFGYSKTELIQTARRNIEEQHDKGNSSIDFRSLNSITSNLTPYLIRLTASACILNDFTMQNFEMLQAGLIIFNVDDLTLQQMTIESIDITVKTSLQIPYSAIIIDCSQVSISSMHLLNNNQTNLRITSQCKGTLKNLEIVGNRNEQITYYQDAQGLISFISTDSVIIADSQFRNNIGIYHSAGLLYFYTITYFSITNCSFSNNTSLLQSGGAIAIFYSNSQSNSITNCTFYNNSSPQHSGGAIYSYQSDFLLSESNFIQNSALIGGAIRFVLAKFMPSFLESYNLPNNIYFNNKALIYGTNVGLFPTKIVNFNSSYDPLTNSIFISNFKSGGTLQFLPLTVLDNEGNKINFSNFNPSNAHSAVQEEISQFKISWSTDKKSDIFVSLGSISLNSTTNQFDIYLSLYVTPNMTKSIFIYTTLTYPYFKNDITSGLSISFQALQLEILVQSRLCQMGEVYQSIDSVYACVECAEGKYSFTTPKLQNPDSVVCSICPPEASYCYMNEMILLNGFWRESNVSETIYTCSKSIMNCREEDEENRMECGEGSIGPLCQSCDNYGTVWDYPYARMGDSTCSKCSDSKFLWVFIMALFSIVLALLFFLVTQSYQTIVNKIKAITIIKLGFVRMGKSAIFDVEFTLYKIIINYVLMIFILSELDSSFPFYITFIQIAGEPIQSIIHSVDCILKSIKGFNIVYLRVIWIFVFSTLIGLSFIVMFSVKYFLDVRWRQKQKQLKLLTAKSLNDRQMSLKKSQNVESPSTDNYLKDQNQNQQENNEQNEKKFQEKQTNYDKNDEIKSRIIQSSTISSNNNSNVQPKAMHNRKAEGFIISLEGDAPIEVHETELSKCILDTKLNTLHFNQNKKSQQLQQLQDYQVNSPSYQDLGSEKYKSSLNLDDSQNKMKRKDSKNMFESETNSKSLFTEGKLREERIRRQFDSSEKNLQQDNFSAISMPNSSNQFLKKSSSICQFNRQENQNQEILFNSGFQRKREDFHNYDLDTNSIFQPDKMQEPHDSQSQFFQQFRLQKEKNSQQLSPGSSFSLSSPNNQPQQGIKNSSVVVHQSVTKRLQFSQTFSQQLQQDATSLHFRWYSQYIKMSLMIILFYMNPGIVRMLISVISCLNIGSQSYIHADPQFTCNNQHTLISYAFILPLILVFTIIIPLVIFFELRNHRSKKTQISLSFLKTYGFIFQEFKQKCFYWDIFRMYFKVLVQFVLVYFESNPTLKIVLCVFLHGIYMITQLKIQPYKKKSLNQIDYLANSVVTISLVLGLLVTSTDILWLRILAFIGIFCFNANFAVAVIKEGLKTIVISSDPKKRTLHQRLLFFIHEKFPVFSGVIQIQKSYQCKILILWKKLSCFVHLHKEILIQKSQSQKELSKAKAFLQENLRMDSNNELIDLELAFSNTILKEPKNPKTDNNSIRQFNEKLLCQLQNISDKLHNTLANSQKQQEKQQQSKILQNDQSPSDLQCDQKQSLQKEKQTSIESEAIIQQENEGVNDDTVNKMQSSKQEIYQFQTLNFFPSSNIFNQNNTNQKGNQDNNNNPSLKTIVELEKQQIDSSPGKQTAKPRQHTNVIQETSQISIEKSLKISPILIQFDQTNSPQDELISNVEYQKAKKEEQSHRYESQSPSNNLVPILPEQQTAQDQELTNQEFIDIHYPYTQTTLSPSLKKPLKRYLSMKSDSDSPSGVQTIILKKNKSTNKNKEPNQNQQINVPSSLNDNNLSGVPQIPAAMPCPSKEPHSHKTYIQEKIFQNRQKTEQFVNNLQEGIFLQKPMKTIDIKSNSTKNKSYSNNNSGKNLYRQQTFTSDCNTSNINYDNQEQQIKSIHSVSPTVRSCTPKSETNSLQHQSFKQSKKSQFEKLKSVSPNQRQFLSKNDVSPHIHFVDNTESQQGISPKNLISTVEKISNFPSPSQL